MKKSLLLLIIGVAMIFATSCKKKETVTPPETPSQAGTLQTMPYTQSFESGFGTYTTKNVIGDQKWAIDYKAATITGHVNEGGSHVYYENEDWLISSPVKISSSLEHAKVVLNYAAQYQGETNDITIQVSSDYHFGNAPETGTWTALPVTIENTDGWTFTDMEASLDNFIGEKVILAVKFTSSTTKSRTIEVKNIKIMAGEAHGGGGTGGEVQNMPYTQSFASSFGTYYTNSVIGDQVWYIDYSSAVMTGHIKVGDDHFYYENEDWLISSPVNVSGVEHAKIVVNYAAQYNGDNDHDVTLQVSENYVWGDSPTTATWTEMDVTYPNTSGWTFTNLETSLDGFIGQTVTVAIKFTSTNEKSRTIEIKSITVEAGEVTPPGPNPGPGTGSGTADDPYNVAAGIALQGQDIVGWVHGYIVGAVKSGLSTVSSNSDVNWSAPFDSNTNVVIADDAACHEITNCIIVNLPNNKPLRTEVNLADHPENLGKTLAVTGKLRTYFGQAGLRDSGGTNNDFVLEGGTPTPPGNYIFQETFASGQGQFTIEDVVLPAELTYIWAHNSSYSCMKASAYVDLAYEAECWLVSPEIDLGEVSTATLKFSQAVNYAAPTGALFVMISTNYSGDVTAADWDELAVDQWPAGNNWTFMNSTADLTSYVGQNVTIAFKYTSSTSASATWEVKNVYVEE